MTRFGIKSEVARALVLSVVLDAKMNSNATDKVRGPKDIILASTDRWLSWAVSTRRKSTNGKK